MFYTYKNNLIFTINNWYKKKDRQIDIDIDSVCVCHYVFLLPYDLPSDETEKK